MTMTQRAARDLVADIIAANGEGDHETAIRVAAWGVEAFPDAAVFHRLRGVALAALGSHDEGKADLHAALATDPLDHETLVTLSRIEEAEGDLYTAAEHLLTAWEHDPANGLLRSDLTYRLARLYGSEGYLQYTRPALAALYVRNAYPERAAREYAAALAEQPNRTDLRLASALARWRLGALTEAADGCVVLLAEQPNLVRARWALADALARRGRGDEAREHAKHAAHLDPDGAIARAMIAGNPDATIIDPDETVRVPLDAPTSIARLTAGDAADRPVPPAFPAAPPSVEEYTTGPFPPPMLPDGNNDGTIDTSLADAPVDVGMSPPAVPDPEFTARANAELDSFEQTIAALERTLAALNAANAPRTDNEASDVGESLALPPAAFADTEPSSSVLGNVEPETAMPPVREGAAIGQEFLSASPREWNSPPAAATPPGGASPLIPPMVHSEWESAARTDTAALEPFAGSAEVPPQPDAEPEPVVAVVTEAGAVLAGYPGAEPLLEDADALPVEDTAPESEPFVAPEPSFARAPDVIREELDTDTPAVPQSGRGTPPTMPDAAATQFGVDVSAPVAFPMPVAPPAPIAVAQAATPPAAHVASSVSTPDALLSVVREHVAAGDAAGAVGFGRAALTAAGKDTVQVRALLPAIRALVEAAPDRPDSRRLLGDTYRRLGQMSQAQGQYQQALLVRVAGKK